MTHKGRHRGVAERSEMHFAETFAAVAGHIEKGDDPLGGGLLVSCTPEGIVAAAVRIDGWCRRHHPGDPLIALRAVEGALTLNRLGILTAGDEPLFDQAHSIIWQMVG